MSELRRAYDLLRGYVNREWERIQKVDLQAAWRELQEGLAPPNREDGSASTEPAEPTEASGGLTPDERARAARSILGVAEGAPFEEIRRAFERLNRRSQPQNFPEGSPEAEQARRIQRRVAWAYRELTDSTSATEKRFRSLEID